MLLGARAGPGPGEGRLPRYAWRDHYATLRSRLDELGQRLDGRYRVLVDENQHVDREGARRAGVGFYGKNTMLITRDHGSWVVLGTLVTDVEIEATAPLDLDCGRCRLCIDACPTGALDEPGVLDANRCLSYWTQAPEPVPEEYREELGASVYGCDICQDVCPWNRGVEKRRRGRPHAQDAVPNVSLRDWLTRAGPALVGELDRLYVPKNDPRWLRRNALYALGNTGDGDALPLVGEWAASDDPLLSDAAAWAGRRSRSRERDDRPSGRARARAAKPGRGARGDRRRPTLPPTMRGVASARARRRGGAGLERLLADRRSVDRFGSCGSMPAPLVGDAAETAALEGR